jgi:hypothetical protein
MLLRCMTGETFGFNHGRLMTSGGQTVSDLEGMLDAVEEVIRGPEILVQDDVEVLQELEERPPHQRTLEAMCGRRVDALFKEWDLDCDGLLDERELCEGLKSLHGVIPAVCDSEQLYLGYVALNSRTWGMSVCDSKKLEPGVCDSEQLHLGM